ncbi:MAG TPA: DUF2752 domain-containing protein [Streptosporangiaceae bacterium]|nr:DUF2752 domain-containing protein [Streptosporangiaceae bacterium]
MTHVAPEPRRRAARRARRLPALGPPAMVLAGAAAVVTYVALVDPNEQGHYPLCPFRAVTGYYCPSCGALRMIYAAAHGHLGEALGRNALAFAMVPVLGYVWLRWAVAAARGRQLRFVHFRPWLVWAFVALVLVFWLVRNLPAGHALAP